MVRLVLLLTLALAAPHPVLGGNFADPAVERFRNGYVAVATGERAPHAWARTRTGEWRRTGPALRRMPAWSRRGDVWAADVRRVGRWWLLYYAAPVKGAGRHGRCIGVARSRSPLRGFEPVGDAPLACPEYLDVPTAQDPLLPRDPTLPRAGVIDPSLYVGEDGLHLLYKTDRIPSTIRIVPLTRSGTRVRRGAVSREVVRSPGVVENPVLVSRPEGWVMLLSEGDFTRCTYRTIWLRSPSPMDWTGAETGVLVDEASSGICGPGGADLAGDRVFLHGWRRGSRSMYAARLGWVGGLPVVERWLRR